MKKISIMLLAALMLFAFVACDDTTEEPKESTLVVSSATKGFTLGDANIGVASDYQKDVKILENGAVEGTFIKKTVDNWGVEAEKTGYYLMADLKIEKGDKFKISNSASTTADAPKEGKYTNDGDNEIICFLGTSLDEVKETEIEIWVAGAEEDFAEAADITLTFANAKVTDAE